MSNFPGTRPGCDHRGAAGADGTFLALGSAFGTPAVQRCRLGFAADVLFRSTRTRVPSRSSCCTGRVTCRGRAGTVFSSPGAATTGAGAATAAGAGSEGSADSGKARSETG